MGRLGDASFALWTITILCRLKWAENNRCYHYIRSRIVKAPVKSKISVPFPSSNLCLSYYLFETSTCPTTAFENISHYGSLLAVLLSSVWSGVFSLRTITATYELVQFFYHYLWFRRRIHQCLCLLPVVCWSVVWSNYPWVGGLVESFDNLWTVDKFDHRNVITLLIGWLSCTSLGSPADCRYGYRSRIKTDRGLESKMTFLSHDSLSHISNYYPCFAKELLLFSFCQLTSGWWTRNSIWRDKVEPTSWPFASNVISDNATDFVKHLQTSLDGNNSVVTGRPFTLTTVVLDCLCNLGNDARQSRKSVE